MATYSAAPATSAKDKDKAEIILMVAALGLTLGGVAGWFAGGVPDAVLGGIAGGVIGGYLTHLWLRRINHVSKDMQLDRE